jgi:hypothetical protein
MAAHGLGMCAETARQIIGARHFSSPVAKLRERPTVDQTLEDGHAGVDQYARIGMVDDVHADWHPLALDEQVTLVQTSYQSRGPYPDLEPSERIRSERIAGRGYESIENANIPEQWDFDAAFEFGLRLILDGVEAAIRRSK